MQAGGYSLSLCHYFLSTSHHSIYPLSSAQFSHGLDTPFTVTTKGQYRYFLIPMNETSAIMTDRKLCLCQNGVPSFWTALVFACVSTPKTDSTILLGEIPQSFCSLIRSKLFNLIKNNATFLYDKTFICIRWWLSMSHRSIEQFSYDATTFLLWQSLVQVWEVHWRAANVTIGIENHAGESKKRGVRFWHRHNSRPVVIGPRSLIPTGSKLSKWTGVYGSPFTTWHRENCGLTMSKENAWPKGC